MIIRKCLLPLVLLGLGACDVVTDDSTDPRFIKELPESVTALAAPYQNLQAVVLLPEDNCYWYSHAGPVETTLLPLRTPQGRPICGPQPVAAAQQ
jgi:hypothetical protein